MNIVWNQTSILWIKLFNLFKIWIKKLGTFKRERLYFSFVNQNFKAKKSLLLCGLWVVNGLREDRMNLSRNTRVVGRPENIKYLSTFNNSMYSVYIVNIVYIVYILNYFMNVFFISLFLPTGYMSISYAPLYPFLPFFTMFQDKLLNPSN